MGNLRHRDYLQLLTHSRALPELRMDSGAAIRTVPTTAVNSQSKEAPRPTSQPARSRPRVAGPVALSFTPQIIPFQPHTPPRFALASAAQQNQHTQSGIPVSTLKLQGLCWHRLPCPARSRCRYVHTLLYYKARPTQLSNHNYTISGRSVAHSVPPLPPPLHSNPS
jgi:hypothetical protein